MVNKILFIGSKSLGFSFLKKLESINYGKKIFVLTIDDSNDERSVLNDIINFSEERGLPTHVISKPSMLKSVLLEVNPDICFVVGWYWILPYDLIKSVKYGFLGFHASLLPKLRGFAPLVWAILNGEKKTGVTLFYFDEGVDSGDIVDQYGFEIGENDYIADLLKKTEAAIAELLKKNINEILAGQNNRTQQNNLHATFCSQRKPVDGLINWSENNVKVDRLIRATSIPYPCAFTLINSSALETG